MQLKEEGQKPQDAAGSSADYQRPVSGGLPLTFYIRSARLCLKKATLARLQERGSGDDELQHLRRFEALVACALPAHREYSERRGEKAVRELHVGLVEARRRIQELLLAGAGVSPTKAAAGSGPSAGYSKKVGSPRKPPLSPGSGASVPRTGSRTRSIQGDKKVARPTKSLILRQPYGPRKIQATPKRAESPTKKTRSPPRYQRGAGPFESRKQLGGSESRQKYSGPASPRKQQSSEDKSSVYYLPKRLPASLQKNRKAVNSVESRFETPSRSSGLRDSTRSWPTERRSRHESPADGLHRLRRSYDDLPTYEDLREFYNDKYEPVTQSTAKSSAWRRENPGTGKAEKVWDNVVYERSRKATPSVSSNATDRFTTPEGRASSYDDSSVKSLVRQLKGSFDGCSTRLEEEGKKWRDRVGAVEKEIEFLRDETEGDLVVIRRTIQEEAKKKEHSIQKLSASLDEGLVKEIESLRVEISRKGDRSWVESFVKNAVMEFLENNRSDEVHSLRAEVASLSKGREELQSNLEQLFQIMENDREFVTTEQAGMKTENGYIRKQLQSVKKEEVEIRSDFEELKRGCHTDIEQLGRSIEKLKEETAEIRIDVKGLEEAMKADRTAARRSDRSRDESTSSAQEKMMIMDRVENLSKLYLGGLDEVRMDIVNIKNKCQDKLEELEDQLRGFKQRQESLVCSRSSPTGTGYDELESRMAQLESKQDMAGLEDIRMAMSNLDAQYRGRLEEIENQLRKRRASESSATTVRAPSRSVVGELETRLSELAKMQEELQMNWRLLDDAVSTAGKERQTAASAASDAAQAATKAAEVLEEVLKYSDPEMKNKLQRTIKLHESLVMEKEAVSAGASEMRRMNNEISRETDSALGAAFEAKRKAEDLQEELKSLVDQVSKQKGAAAQAAAKTASLATESEDLLSEMSVMRRKVQLETEADASERKKPVSKKQVTELEKRVEALEKTKSEKSWKVSTKGRSSFTSVKRKPGSEEDDLSKADSRLGNLENHLEHVASATYTNLRILDTKVEHVSVTAQSALEGASLAESKCGALGAELVKVFRVLASFKREEKQSCRSKDSCSSSSPGKRPQFGRESCKKAANLTGSLSSLSLDGSKPRGVKRINVRLGAAAAEKDQEQAPAAEREQEPRSKNRAEVSPERRVKDTVQRYRYVRRSWGPTEMTQLAEEDDDDVETKRREVATFDDFSSWGIRSQGISVIQSSVRPSKVESKC